MPNTKSSTYTITVQKMCLLGGLGHIGSGFIRYMETNYSNFEITIVDNFSTGKLNSLFGHSLNLRNIHEMDVRDPELFHLLKTQDIVVHLAANNKAYDLVNQSLLYRHNIECTKNIVKACQSCNIPLIFLSSTSIYEKSAGTVDESSLVVPPQNLYALSKLHEEEIVSSYTNGYILRLGTIHGISPGMNFHTTVNKFCWDALNKNIINIWKATADLTSPYLSLNDLVAVLSKMVIENMDFTVKKILNLVSHNSTPFDIFKKIKQIIPEVEYRFVEGHSLRKHNLIVQSMEKEITNLLNSESVESDIERTIDLLTTGKINWETFYKIGGK